MSALGALEAADLCGGHCWVERRLFEVLGAWSLAASAPVTVVLLDRHSQHAAWRAGQWWERLPVRAGVEREELVVAPAGWEGALGAAGSRIPPPGGDPALLWVVHRVLLARLATRYRRHQERVGPLADAPTARTLLQVLADVRSDGDEGRAALEELMGDREDLESASSAGVGVESAFVVGYGEQA